MLVVPASADTMIRASGFITVDEDNLITTGTHTATIQELDSIHLFESWHLQGRLEKPSETVVALCNDSGVAGAGQPQLECETVKEYMDCNQAFGAQRGWTDSQILISETHPDNVRTSKRLATRHMECSSHCFADDTNTVFLSLGGGSHHMPLKTSGLTHRLVRTKQVGGERFVMDEWAVELSGDRAVAPKSSSGRFRDIVDTQLPEDLRGSYLVIQEPVHELDRRWIPLPEIQIGDTSLGADRKGSGEIVAIRAEIFKDQYVEDVQVLYGSRPIDEAWITDLVRERLSLKFLSQKEHPTVAFLVLRIGEQLEVVGSRSVLPKCCQCVSWPCT